MSPLDRNERALLELLAMQPLSVMPPMHRVVAHQLCERGFAICRNEFWHATASGLQVVGRTIH